MDISTAYKQNRQILNIHSQIQEVKQEIKKVDFAFNVAFVGTFALYFCFIWGMYVADLWGFTTWLTRNISEFAALLVYGVLAIALPLTMALIKEIAYRHFSNYPNNRMMIILIVGILALAGVIYESITSSSQQQHMSFNSAENSKTFDAITNSGATVETGSIASLIGSARAKLAKCKKMVERGAWSDCAESEARLNGYLESEQRSMQSAERASVAAIEAKTTAIKDLKEENHKPVFKAIRDSFGVSINTGIMAVTIFVSAVFEVSHLLLIMLLAQKKQRLVGLEAALINNESDYMRSTGKTFKPEDFSDDSVLDMNEVREKSPSPIGFGMPATGFKYQEVKKQPAGFVQTDHLPNQPKAGNQGVNARAETYPVQPEQPVMGKVETSTYNHELSGHGIHSPEDKALDKTADKEAIQRIINKGLEAGKPPEETASESTSKPPAGSLQKAPDKTPSKPPAGGAEGLYGRWLAAVNSGECRPSVDGTWKWIQKRTASRETGKSSFHRTHISTVQKGFFSRAIHDGLMMVNPKFKRGGKKYLWIGEQANV